LPTHFANLIAALDLDTPFYSGTLAGRPAFNAAGHYAGEWYWATDTQQLFFNTGAAWVAIAPLNNVALTGIPTAPEPAIGDNSLQIATTEFVRFMVPPGLGPLPYMGATAPPGWLLCDGTAYSRTTYAALFAVIGTAGGAGDGSTTFNVPDMRGRIPVGLNTGTFNSLGKTGGEETHVLSQTEMPSHTHTGTTAAETTDHTHSGVTSGRSAAHSHTYTVPVLSASFSFTPGGDVACASTTVASTSTESSDHTHSYTTGGRSSAHTHTFTTASTGGGGAHNNIQPYFVTNYIIKT